MTFVLILGTLVAAISTFVLHYSSTYYARRARMLEKVPVSPVAEIEEEGAAKVIGTVTALEKILLSPLTRSKCVYYRILIQHQKAWQEAVSNFRRRGEEKEGGLEWETIVDEVKSVAFAIEDDTGLATVEPAHVEVEVKSSRRVDSGFLTGLSVTQEKLLCDRYPEQKFSFTKKMRYKEIVIEEGDEMVITGEIDLPKDDHPRFRAIEDDPIHISDQTENRAVEASRNRAKSHLIYSGVTGTCTIVLIVWLIIHLASAKRSTSSHRAETAGNTPSLNKN